MSRAFLLRSVVFPVSFSLLAACAGSGGSASGPLPQTGALAVGTPQRSVSSSASKPSAVTYKPLYTFKGQPDGALPANLISMNGVFYGTTAQGGVYPNVKGGNGTIFEMSASGAERVLYSFQGGADGAIPYAGLTAANGVLYGVTYGGDTATDYGTVFTVSASGVERVIYNFKGGADGIGPYANLTAENGVLYGTTAQGGANNVGTIFAVSTSGVERVLHTFGSGTDGVYPYGHLIDVNGLLYGTTALGGASNEGTVFTVNRSGGAERVLHSFQGSPDGAVPYAGLIDVNGVLYGTTGSGGVNACYSPTQGCGTVFKMSTSGTESVVYRFQGGTDGRTPQGDLTNVKGILYGTTAEGGTSNYYGTIFKVSTSGAEGVLYGFQDTDGAQPKTSLIKVNNALYGTTYGGGATYSGTVFEISL